MVHTEPSPDRTSASSLSTGCCPLVLGGCLVAEKRVILNLFPICIVSAGIMNSLATTRKKTVPKMGQGSYIWRIFTLAILKMPLVPAQGPIYARAWYIRDLPITTIGRVMKQILRVAVLVTVLVAFQVVPQAAFASEQKAVLITGASTGIGRHLAETLAGEGYRVYAGARKDKDLAELDAIDNIMAVRLDVTKQDQVDAAVAMIEEKGTGLYGLVNNAGVGGGGFVTDTSIEDQSFVYAVNVEGVYRTTKAFAPLVIESKGRIITTGSIAGTVSWPGGSAYSGSKHWMEAFTDALAGEMAKHEVGVSVVEPGNYKSDIRRSYVSRELRQVEKAGGEVTEEMKQDYEKTAARELSYKEPDEVTEAFMHALFSDAPLLRYMVVPNQQEAELTIGTKLNELVQLNQWSPHAYSRDELVQMLDAALNPEPAAEEE